MESSITVRFADLGWPIISPLISWQSGHWSNHCDLMLDLGDMVSALPGGVRQRGLSSLPVRREQTVVLQCSRLQREEAQRFALDQIGKPYDYAGVIAFPFRPRWNDARRWFCSELTAAALHRAGIIVVPGPTWRVSPGALLALCLPHQI